jgi:hypothetical protein
MQATFEVRQVAPELCIPIVCLFSVQCPNSIPAQEDSRWLCQRAKVLRSI